MEESKPTGFLLQFKALVLRNFLLSRRKPSQVISPIISAVIITIFVLIINAAIQPKSKEAIESLPRYPLRRFAFSPPADRRILVSPDTADARAVVNLSALPNEVRFVADEEALLDAYRVNRIGYAAGVVFSSVNSSEREVKYSIRLPFDDSPSVVAQDTNCYQSDGLGDCTANQYLSSGFVALQVAIESGILKWMENGNETTNNTWAVPGLDNWQVQMTPLPFLQPNTIALSFVLPIMLPLTMSGMVNSLMVNLCDEKEKKIKDSMRVMGMLESAFWLSWGAIYYLLALILAIVVVVLFVIGKIFAGNAGIIFIALLLYFWSTVSLSFFLSAFIKKAKTAGTLGSLAVFIMTFMYLALQIPVVIGEDVPVWSYWIAALLPPLAFASTLNAASVVDHNIDGGLQFSNIGDIIDNGSLTWNFSVSDGLVMLTVDTILFFILAVYFENIIPGTLGYRLQPWYFLDPSYWGLPKAGRSKVTVTKSSISIVSSNVEPIPRELNGKDVLKIQNLCKHFWINDAKGCCKSKKLKKAVDDLSMDLYEGQISCLLGHNGAGKTTTINILTGLMMPTSGTATYYGYDIRSLSDLTRIRSMTGVCPQHDILFDNLTCEEHLVMFAQLKGVKNVSEEVDRLLDAVLLQPKRKTPSKSLSGGQKRKLSVAIALIGNPKFIFLDEPSAGLDPYSRRALWSLLKAEKKDRVILLTTHFMDEADILSDRKAVIADGSLRCMGSSLFLKNRFGIGYHLNMSLFKSNSLLNSDCVNSVRQQVTELIQRAIPSSQEIRFHGLELSYALSQNEVRSFPKLFRLLDNFVEQTKNEACGVQSYGVSMTSLEEVFLKIGEEKDSEDRLENLIVEVDDDEDENSMPSTPLIKKPSQLVWQRFSNLVWLRILLVFSNVAAVIFTFLLPIALTVLGCYIMSLVPEDAGTFGNYPIPMSKLMFSRSKMSVNASPTIFYDSEPQNLAFERLATNGPNKVELLNIDLNNDTAISDFLAKNNETSILAGMLLRGNTLGENQTVLYNITKNAIVPSVVNWFSNIIASAQPEPKQIRLTNYALPNSRINNPLASNSIFFIASAIAISVPMHAAVDTVKDRYFKTRSQLRIMGVTINMYWLAVFTWDILCAYFIMAIALIAVKGFSVVIISQGASFAMFALFYVTYLPMLVLFGYTVSFAFDSVDSVTTSMPGLLILTSVVPFIVINNLNADYGKIAEALHFLFSFIFPHYTMFGGMFYLMQFQSTTTIVEREHTLGDILADSLVSVPFAAILLWILIFCIALPLLDMWKSNGFLICRSKKPKREQDSNGIVNEAFSNHLSEGDSEKDEDVETEKKLVANLRSDERDYPTVVVKNLHKIFNKMSLFCFKRKKEESKVAVKDISFAVNRGEIFGLLGPNGAGKSTTMNIISAECEADGGEVFVGGHSISSSQSAAFQVTGYCPQHNPLYMDLTVRTHLRLYASVRGIQGNDAIRDITDYLMRNLKISEHADKACKDISGGTKRKLCFAISLLGVPEIVLMDEPSTGMDPSSKRFLWDTITNTFKGTERGAILTTHSMEEADALCSRIAIMIQGEMKCVGTSQHLKDKYGSGYLLEVKLKPMKTRTPEMEEESFKEFKRFVEENFKDETNGEKPEVKENFGGKITFKVPKSCVKSLGDVFEALEMRKEEEDIEEYSFSQSTLEQVFLDFAKLQVDEKGYL